MQTFDCQLGGYNYLTRRIKFCNGSNEVSMLYVLESHFCREFNVFEFCDSKT